MGMPEYNEELTLSSRTVIGTLPHPDHRRVHQDRIHQRLQLNPLPDHYTIGMSSDVLPELSEVRM